MWLFDRPHLQHQVGGFLDRNNDSYARAGRFAACSSLLQGSNDAQTKGVWQNTFAQKEPVIFFKPLVIASFASLASFITTDELKSMICSSMILYDKPWPKPDL